MALAGDATSEGLEDHTTPLEPGNIPIEIVYDSGDVILLADDGTHSALRIKVSSTLLSVASKVFRALFSSHFAEGQAMRNSGDSVVELRMRDKPADFLLLCQLLHYQGDIGSTSHEQFLSFAFMIDKFDCIKALRHATESRFAVAKSGSSGAKQANISFAAAVWILDDARFFRVFTKHLVLDYEDGFPSLSNTLLVALPHELLSSIRAQRAFAYSELTYQISKWMAKYHAAANYSGANAHFNTLAFMMCSCGLWPLDPRRTSLGSAFQRLRTVQIPIMEADNLYRGRDPYSDDGPYKSPTQTDLANAVRRVELFCPGVCLDCFKGKDVCRMPHVDPFDNPYWFPPRYFDEEGGPDYGSDTKRSAEWDSAW